METALWTGLTKLTQPRVRLAAGPMGWAADVSDAEFRAVGLLEVLGALGLVLPGASGIAQVLTPAAAVGLALTWSERSRRTCAWERQTAWRCRSSSSS